MRRRQAPVLERVRERDPEGRIVVHHRVVDTLGRMLQAGTIDAAMHDAGRAFQRSFVLAQLDPLRAADLLRVPGNGRAPEPGECPARRPPARAPGRGGARRALAALPAPASGTCWAWGARCGSGRCARAGAAGRCGRSRRKGSWWRHSAC